MLFNSFEFLVFFSIVVPLYFLLPRKYTWVLLLFASYIFYAAWEPAYLSLIILSTIIDYFAARLMSKQREKRKRRRYLILSLISNLGILFIFKYFNFFNDVITSLIHTFGYQAQPLRLNVLLPVGISFYTFQTLSYTIDVYRGRMKAEKNFGIFALYVSFFPQLVAGPIERSTHLLPQFKTIKRFDWERVTDGLVLMLWGYFKKMVIADRISVFVDYAYNNPNQYSGWILLVATFFFAFQIYCDFSGYSDIAIGAAKVLGFDLMKNFERPYFSKSIREFWRRWHISLSTWFKDYLYIPLGGNRVALPRHLLNLLITFTISGLWHGASYNFVLWGMLHGIYLIIGELTQRRRKKILRWFGINGQCMTLRLIRMAVTFILVNIGWVFFRAISIENAGRMFRGMTNLRMLDLVTHNMELNPMFYTLGLSEQEFKFAIISILFLLFVEWIQGKGSLVRRLKAEPLVSRMFVYYGLLIIILIYGVYGNYDQLQFIYFAF